MELDLDELIVAVTSQAAGLAVAGAGMVLAECFSDLDGRCNALNLFGGMLYGLLNSNLQCKILFLTTAGSLISFAATGLRSIILCD